ncbi:histidine kinase [Microbacterium sp.]|uniref:sensor histidine kinase n=1 Tax=Microbacterium sp. TaxID=51671 RepID=UPI002810BC54|nr:histidine kinase [Microbacterium sp.]
MSTSRSRSVSVLEDEELRLPRPPGVIRRFWARHPVLADVLIALFCLTASLVPATSFRVSGVLAALATPLAVLIACALLLRRRRWPVAAFVAAWAASATYLLESVPVGGPLVLVTAYSLAVYRSARACWTGLAIGLSSLTLLAFALSSLGAISFVIAINAVIGELVMGLIGALIGINVGNRKRYLEAVIDRSRQLLVERDQHARLAAASERERIAREMHDIVSHSLTVVVALSEGAAATADRDRARAASTAAAATARSALTEMRSMLGVLRDGGTDAPLAPLEPASPAETVAAAQRAGFTASLTVRGEPDAPPALRFAIGRIVQEGVTNAMRHAPGTSAIEVRIDHDSDPIVIEIANDGATGRASEGGFGLRGLAERAGLLGGTVVSSPVGQGGWMLHAELPHPDGAALTTTVADEVSAAQTTRTSTEGIPS